jgi:DNA-binding transcriptional LysR family regulator
MPKILQRGAAKTQRPPPLSRLDGLHWDDLRVFLACAESSSFREASRVLNLSSSTVTRRVERLEGMLGIELFHRLPEGGTPTITGLKLAEQAKAMHQSLCELERKRAVINSMDRCEVTIAVTEGLGSYWVMPQLVELQRTNPMTAINLLCSMESVDVLRLEADMAIQFIKPENPDLIVVKLGRLHVYPFASRHYLDTYGTPKSRTDIVNHRLVEQVALQLDNKALARYFGLENIDDIVAVRTNASSAHLYAIEKGAGIGVLPTFALALGAPVVPVDIGDGYARDVWLTFHPTVKKCSYKRAAIGWLRDMFNPAVYPWFSDRFLHPTRLLDVIPEKARINHGQGFLASNPSDKIAMRRPTLGNIRTIKR